MDDVVRKHLVLAREHYEKREYDRAEGYLLEVLKHVQTYADVYNMLGVIRHDGGDFQEARRQFEKALEINPSYTEASLNLAVTYNDLGLYSEARRVYGSIRGTTAGASATPLDPYARGKIANMHADVGSAYADFGLHAEAAAEFRKALGLAPQFADVRTKLATVLRDMHDLEGAIAEYREALKQNGKYVAAHVLLGVTLLGLGDRAAAEKEWEAALAVDPQNRSALMYLRMLRGSATQSSLPPAAPNLSGLHPITLAESRPDIAAPPPDKIDDE